MWVLARGYHVCCVRCVNNLQDAHHALLEEFLCAMFVFFHLTAHLVWLDTLSVHSCFCTGCSAAQVRILWKKRSRDFATTPCTKCVYAWSWHCIWQVLVRQAVCLATRMTKWLFYGKMVLLVSVVNVTPGPVHPYFQFYFVFVAVVLATRHLEVNILMSGWGRCAYIVLQQRWGHRDRKQPACCNIFWISDSRDL